MSKELSCVKGLHLHSLLTRLTPHYSGLRLNVKSTERPLEMESTLPFVNLAKFISAQTCSFSLSLIALYIM